MRTLAVLLLAALGLSLATARAADLPLLAASGIVDKTAKGSLTLQPRGAKGTFEKAIVLRVTDTARITTLVPQMRAGKLVITQRETDLKDLTRKQKIACTYTVTRDGPVLLSAVVEPAGK